MNNSILHNIVHKSRFRQTAVKLLLLASAVFIPQSCGIYSFSGVSLNSGEKTIQIDYFPNNAPLVNPVLSSQFTTKLQDLFIARTSLSLVKSDADLVLEGEITRYEQTSVAPTIDPSTGKAVAGKVRLTIGVKVRFYNNKDETQNFDREFSNFTDIPGTETLSGSQEQAAVDDLVELLANDIFNQSVAQW